MAGFASWAINCLLIYLGLVVVYNWHDIEYISDFEDVWDMLLGTVLEHKWTAIPLVLGLVAAGYYVVIAIIWVFKLIFTVLTSWITWAIIGGVGAIVGLVFLLKFLVKCSHRSLEKKLKSEISVPVKVGSITSDNYGVCDALLRKAKSLKQKVSECKDKNELVGLKKELADTKLNVFYVSSIAAETASYSEEKNFGENFFEPLKKTFTDQNWYRMRCDKDESLILQGKSLPIYSKAPYFVKILKDNKMTPILEELEEAKEIRTNKFFLFTDTKKLAEKTQLFQSLYKEARSEFNELSEVTSKVNCMLKYARTCAYRNIYLGAELLNIIRENSGGAGLETAQNFVSTDTDAVSVYVDSNSISVDTLSIVKGSVSNALDYFEKNADYVSKNPKESIGIAALATVGNLLQARSEAINANLNAQTKILNEIPKITESYSAGQANTLRAIELLKAIIKANSGFTAIYAPLRDKVFVENAITEISMKDIQQLAKATSEYNKISRAEL